MEVNIYGRNIKVTERLEEYVNEKVQKFAQLGDNVKDIDVQQGRSPGWRVHPR